MVVKYPQIVLKSPQQQLLEAEHGRDLAELVAEWYEKDGMSQAEIAERLGLDSSTISRWMRQWGIQLRYGAARKRRLRTVQ
jgi:transposase